MTLLFGLMPEFNISELSPDVVVAVRFPATVTLANVSDIGVYELASPISYVRVGEPVAIFFCRLPTMCPLVRETDPVEGIMTENEFVVIFPLVSVSVEFTVMLDDREREPDALLIVTLLNVPVDVTVCVPVPLNRRVVFVFANVPPLIVQLPPMLCVVALDDGANVPEESVALPVIVKVVPVPPVNVPPDCV